MTDDRTSGPGGDATESERRGAAGDGGAESGGAAAGGATPMRTSAAATGPIGSPYIPLVHTESPFEFAGIIPPSEPEREPGGEKACPEKYPVFGKVENRVSDEELARSEGFEMAVRVSVELKRLRETIVGMGIPAERLVLCHEFHMLNHGMAERWWWEVKQK
jgi:hypothetical protein